MRPNTKTFATSAALIALLSAGPIMAQDTTTDPMTEDPETTMPADETMPADDGMTDDGMTDDTMTDDGMADDGMADDGMVDDGMTDDGMTDDSMMDDGMMDDTMTEDTMTDDAVIVDDSMAADTAATVTPPEGYIIADFTTFTADQLLGTHIYGLGTDGEEHIGAITDFVVGDSPDAAIAQIITDVGGFLGIGQRSVSIPVEDFTLFSDADGNLRGHVAMTREQIEALPEFTPPME